MVCTRKKLINTIIYFIGNTDHLGKVKLYKLLSLLDFAHFNQTGKSVTGLTYSAWDRGPAPASFDSELKEGNPFPEQIDIGVVGNSVGYHSLKFKALVNFDDSLFTRRELKLLKEISEKYKSATGIELIEITHREGSPWKKTKLGFQIDYMNAVDGTGLDAEEIQERLSENTQIEERYFG